MSLTAGGDSDRVVEVGVLGVFEDGTGDASVRPGRLDGMDCEGAGASARGVGEPGASGDVAA
ncbi:hypothetical protein, partial [Streptomyces anatolicus]|uniref:hypothetical protein n=1 Tax=Streptomyces anatolicus TaxID=2675858 RepID=UPI001CA5A744